MTTPARPPALQALDEVLEEQEGGLAGADGEVLLDLLALLAAEGRVGEDDVEAVPLLNVGQVLRQGVGVEDVGGLQAVQDQVHDRDHVGQGLLLLAVEGAGLEGLQVLGGERARALQVVEGLAQEARGTAGPVVDGLADLGVDHPDHGADEGARGVVLAAVAPGVAHALDLFLIEGGELVLLGLGAEAQGVDVVYDLAQVVAAGDLVFDLAEDLADLVFDGVGPGGPALEAVQVGE